MSARFNISWLLVLLVFSACTEDNSHIIKEIKIGKHNNNELQIQIDVQTERAAAVVVEYWPDSLGEKAKSISLVSPESESHSVVLTNIIPETKYDFRVITERKGQKGVSKNYDFHSLALPVWLQDQFKYSCINPEFLPAEFKSGLMLMNKRESPGIAYIVDYKGRIKWYHMVDGTGIKVVHFTADTTVLAILGKNDEPTSYGSEILEVNLLGDTITHVKKGEGDLKYTIHHEVLKRNKNELVTLYVDQRIMDLTSVGGSAKDTINGDGILIMDAKGKKIWQWSVFDVMDPLRYPNILKEKNDWMHANSLSYDKDSNFIISFYNNGQIWKLDSHTGKVIWKFGKGGDISMPAECNFTQAHAAHINPYGSLLFFDNGVEKHQSEVFAVKLDEAKKSSSIDIHIKLPQEVYNERMGSAYMINDTTVLCCCSKKHMTVLANTKGYLLWTLKSAIPPYRVEYLKREQLSPYLNPLTDN